MATIKFHHTHLISAEPEKTADFYVKMFGAKKGETRKMPNGSISVPLDLNGSPIMVSSPRLQPPKYGLDHFGISTTDMDSTIKELKAAGVKFQMEPTEIRPGMRIAFFWGPENVLIEIAEEKA
jgi:catechol 2,3-dioxygenase-like lactoylglutathione lyase family enzyme